MTKTKYLPYVEKAYDDLIKLRQSLTGKTEIAHRYIGTVISNTAALLTAPCNSIDEGKRKVIFSDDSEIFSLIQAIMRSFLSSLHATAEIGIEKILEDRQIEVVSSFKKTKEKKFAKFQDVSEEVKEFVTKIIERYKPSFEDKLNEVIKQTSLNNEDRQKWRKFFQGLTIARNKASHSDPSLTEGEKETLLDGDLSILVTEEGDLQVDPRIWHQLAEKTLDFFENVNYKIINLI